MKNPPDSLYAKLQVIPSGHAHPAEGPLKARSCEQVASQSIDTEDMYAPLKANPYLPFFHVWKPNAKWTSAKWDKASEEGLKTLPPQFWIGVVE
jgi:tRNA-splicing endonuclease subunit Sen54